MRKVLAGIGLVSLLLGTSTGAQAAWPRQFVDVDTWPAWGIMGKQLSTGDYVFWGGDLAEAVWFELMVGDPPQGRTSARRTFRPYDSITRAEFATVLARALGIDEQRQGGAEWFRPTVVKLQEVGIITSGGAFNVPITRREMGDWVGRALEWYGVELGGKSELSFRDIAGLPEVSYILLASKADVIKGYPDGTYGPERTATRAEAAAMALRLAKQLKKNPPGPEVFEQHTREHVAIITEIEKELVQGKPYNHSHLLEPYLSEMTIYGSGGIDYPTKWIVENRKIRTYSELVSLSVEPVFMRDTIAVVKIDSTFRVVGLDEKEIELICERYGVDRSDVEFTSDSAYHYYAKRNGRWIGTNTMEETSLYGLPPVGGISE